VENTKARPLLKKVGLIFENKNIMQKVIVYVDGFNFYYGLKKNHKWRRFYWLDVVKFFELFMKPDQELVRVKYFSAISLFQ